MRYRQLEVFEAIYSHGSISAAARALGVSQPTLSKTLHHLEDSLSLRLFLLSRGRLIPTDEAHALMKEAGDIFDRLRGLRQTAINLSRSGGGHIRLGVAPSLALDLIPQALAAFRRDAPEITFEIYTLHHEELADALIERKLDIALAYAPPPHSRLAATVVASGELGVFFPVGALPVTGDRLPLTCLDGRDVIGVTAAGPVGRVLTTAIEQTGIIFRESVSVQTFFVAARLAQLEGGLTVIDEFTARAASSSGFRWMRTTPQLVFNVSAVTLADRPMSRATKRFLRVLEATLKAVRADEP
jgi:DNA-binding transcriptional LysR family regulator